MSAAVPIASAAAPQAPGNARNEYAAKCISMQIQPRNQSRVMVEPAGRATATNA
jgi:hypothetical protein